MKHPQIGWPGTTSTNTPRRLPCRRLALALAGFVPVLAMAIGCGGKESTASKSASAFDEAVKKGESPGAGEAHGGHSSTSGGTEHGHGATSPSPAEGDGSMAGMDHSTAPGGKSPGMAGMDRPAMPGMGRSGPSGAQQPGMAGMDHSKMGPAGSNSAASANHSGMAGMDHDMAAMRQMGHVGAALPLPPEPPVAVAQPGQPATILRPDSIDTPAQTAVMDATRAAAMAAEMAGGGHAMSHGTYKQVDAGRDMVRAPMPMTGGHEGHQPAPSTSAPMAPGAHGAHGQPAPATSSPSGVKPTAPTTPAAKHQHESAPPKTSPSPPADLHRMHAAPSPRPQPSPSPGGNQ